jgi:homoserine O-acetyltransferase
MPIFHTRDFLLSNGARLAELQVAYIMYGTPTSDFDNVILATHGITSTHLGGDEPTLDRRRGWWHEIIGSGKLFDTDRYCIVASNILGSCYGTTGPASIDPATGEPYGADFPEISYEDIVHAQYLMLRSLDVKKLVAVAGASVGGFQAFQWAVSYPDLMSGIIALDTGPWDTMNIGDSIPGLMETLATDPNWNGGKYYSRGGLVGTLTDIRIRTLRSYGIAEKLAASHRPEEIESVIELTAQQWAEEFDAHALLRQMQAWANFDLRGQLDRIQASVLYVLCDTDEIFPSSIGRKVTSALQKAGVDTTFHEIKSTLGHYATAEEPEKWIPVAKRFLQDLSAT